MFCKVFDSICLIPSFVKPYSVPISSNVSLLLEIYPFLFIRMSSAFESVFINASLITASIDFVPSFIMLIKFGICKENINNIKYNEQFAKSPKVITWFLKRILAVTSLKLKISFSVILL